MSTWANDRGGSERKNRRETRERKRRKEQGINKRGAREDAG